MTNQPEPALKANDRSATQALAPVLVAEDNESDAERLQMAWYDARIKNKLELVADGSEVVRYLTGADEYADRGRFPIPALLLLDLKMPKMGGMEVLEWLYPRPRPPFACAVLTGERLLTPVVQAFRRRAYAFLLKPLQYEDLKAFVEKFKGIEVENI
jgi:CheY-like chemotaxis protein